MSYLQKNQRYTLLKFKSDINTFDELKEKILSKTYEEPLRARNIPDDLTEDEKTFYSKWMTISNENEIKFENSEQFSYIKTTALCEFSTRQIRDSTTGVLLPKRDRLNTSLIDVLFIKSEGIFYIVVFSIDFYDLRRIKRLIGESQIDPITSKHQTNSELFNWLFYKFIKTEFNMSDEIYLDNINGFTGNVIDEENHFEGRSIQTAELIITKAFITNGYPITSIRIDLQMSDATISFYLNELSDNKELKMVVVKNSSVSILMNNEDMEFVIPIYTFLYLIPEVVRLYKESEDMFLKGTKKTFLSEIGIEVIKTIMAKNNIKIEEIK